MNSILLSLYINFIFMVIDFDRLPKNIFLYDFNTFTGQTLDSSRVVFSIGNRIIYDEVLSKSPGTGVYFVFNVYQILKNEFSIVFNKNIDLIDLNISVDGVTKSIDVYYASGIIPNIDYSFNPRVISNKFTTYEDVTELIVFNSFLSEFVFKVYCNDLNFYSFEYSTQDVFVDCSFAFVASKLPNVDPIDIIAYIVEADTGSMEFVVNHNNDAKIFNLKFHNVFGFFSNIRINGFQNVIPSYSKQFAKTLDLNFFSDQKFDKEYQVESFLLSEAEIIKYKELLAAPFVWTENGEEIFIYNVEFNEDNSIENSVSVKFNYKFANSNIQNFL